jgi:hypothetical protein
MSSENHRVEIITPEQAATILEPKLAELQAEGWIILMQTDYIARLTRGDRNLDVQVDLLGNLETQEKPLTLVQDSGQVIGILLTILLVLVVLVLISILHLDLPI